MIFPDRTALLMGTVPGVPYRDTLRTVPGRTELFRPFGFDRFQQVGNDLEEVADDTVIRDTENRG